MMEAAAQVIAFQKSWRSFSPITVCILAQCQCRTQGGGGGTRAPNPQRKRAVSVLNNFCLVWGVLGCFNGPHDCHAFAERYW